jgi:hypothetical protein
MLSLGINGDGLEDLSGGLSFDLMLRSPTAPTHERVFEHVIQAYERGSLMCLGIMSAKDDKVISNQ